MTVPDPFSREVRKRQRSRAVVMAIALLAFAVLIYFVTIAKMAVYGA
jgi:hypothetical protein